MFDIEEAKENLGILIDATKDKILDLAIKGKLVSQNPNDEPASVLLDRIRAKKESVIYKGDDNSYYRKSMFKKFTAFHNTSISTLPSFYVYI